ncbi:MAG TPA: Qat anti-phage system associated protein QatB [Puia sp.]
MGTSASGGGAGGSNPLIPSWIGSGGGGLPPDPPPQPPPGPTQPGNNDGDNGDAGNNNEAGGDNNAQQPAAAQVMPSPPTVSNRYTGQRRQFNKFLRSGGTDSRALKNALRDYSRHAAGGTRQMARRMQPSASRVATFYEVVNTVRERGKQQALIQFNLGSYQDKPLLDILSSFSDTIFQDTGKIYEDTQDDSITKHAYANTVVRICELDGIDLDHLTNQQVEIMMAIFIEETIAQRVINDIGNSLTENNTNISELVEMENNIYQIVSGLVRNQIMPEIIVTQRGDGQHLEMKIENIYRIAFDTMAGQND